MILTQVLLAAEPPPLPGPADWRIDDVPSARDNGWRSEVVLNGAWILTKPDGSRHRVLVPGGLAEVITPSGATAEARRPQAISREIIVPETWAGRRLTIEAAASRELEIAVDGSVVGRAQANQRFREFVIPAQAGRRTIALATSGKLSDDVWLRSYPPVGSASITDSFISTSFRSRSASVALSGTAAPGSAISLQVFISETADGPALLTMNGTATAANHGSWSTSLSTAWPDARLWSRWNPYLYWYRVEASGADGRITDRLLPRRFGFREVWIEQGSIMVNGVPTTVHGDTWHNYVGNPVNRARVERETRALKAQGMTWGSFTSELAQDVADELGLIGSRNIGSVVRLDVWNPRNGFTAMNGSEHLEDIERTVRRLREHPSILFWTSAAPYSQVSMHPEYTGRPVENWRFFPLNRASAPCREAQLVFKDMQERIQTTDPSRVVACSQGPFTAIDQTTRYLTSNLDLQEREEFFEDWSRARERQAIVVSEWGSLFSAEYFLRPIDFTLHQDKAPNGQHTPKLHVESAARQFGESAYQEESDAQIAAWTRTNGLAIRGNPGFQRLISENIQATVRAWRTYGVNALGHHILSEDCFVSARQNRDPLARDGFRELADPRVPGAAFLTGPGWAVPGLDEAYPAAAVWAASHQPLYAYLGGGDRFITKDHLFFAGSEVRKAAIVLNDYDVPVAVAGEWTLCDSAGAVIQCGALQATIAPGARSTADLPIVFTAPQVAGRSEFTLRLSLRSERAGVLADAIALTVFPVAKQTLPAFSGTVWVLNISDQLTHETPHPVLNRENEALLRAAGLQPRLLAGLRSFAFLGQDPQAARDWFGGRQPVIDGIPKSGDLLIIPRQTLTAGSDEGQLNLRLLVKLDLDHLVEQGLRVLVLEQDLPNVFGLQTENVRPRRAFIAAPGHPVFAGLEESDLSYWSGTSDLQDPIEPLGTGARQFPERMWHVSSTNAIASRTYIRPQVGAVRALAVSGFDLGESPLLEVTRGKGRMLFCSFDVSNRYGQDPAATRLLDNLLAYAMSAPEPDPTRSEVETITGAEVETRLNLYRAAKPVGAAAWGITTGELFFRESVYQNTYGAKPTFAVPVLANTSVEALPAVVRSVHGRLSTTLAPEICATGWGRRKILWLRSALVVNQGGSRSDGPSLAQHGLITVLYPEPWVEGFVHPYNANIW